MLLADFVTAFAETISARLLRAAVSLFRVYYVRSGRALLRLSDVEWPKEARVTETFHQSLSRWSVSVSAFHAADLTNNPAWN